MPRGGSRGDAERRALANAVDDFEALGARRIRQANGCLVVRLPAAELEQKPWLRWNAFVALLSYSALEELHPEQHAAWHAHQYDSDVQGGGHAVFLNRQAGAALDDTVGALAAVGAPGHAERLRQAVELWRRGGATDDQLAIWDAAFANAQPPLSEVLEAYLASHADHFVATTLAFDN
jgi:hypothetical protein